jgi:hypothetical protein
MVVMENVPAPDALPLALLAAGAHPEQAVRARVGARLDAWLAARGPLHAERQVRRFVEGRACRALDLGDKRGLARGLASRVLRLVFARATSRNTLRRFVLFGAGPRGEEGLRLNARLRSGGAARDLRQGKWTTRLDVTEAADRVAGLGSPPEVRAFCSLAGGAYLALEGELPWRYGPPSELRLLRTGGRVELPGLMGERRDGRVVLRSDAPEAVLRLSALLVREERLVVTDTQRPPHGWVVVGLRDFDGLRADLPAVVCTAFRQEWVRNLPEAAFDLPARERREVSRWLFPRAGWLTDDDLERLI